jgi:hypothetical protein
MSGGVTQVVENLPRSTGFLSSVLPKEEGGEEERKAEGRKGREEGKERRKEAKRKERKVVKLRESIGRLRQEAHLS